jgi:hypothetical protein
MTDSLAIVDDPWTLSSLSPSLYAPLLFQRTRKEFDLFQRILSTLLGACGASRHL